MGNSSSRPTTEFVALQANLDYQYGCVESFAEKAIHNYSKDKDTFYPNIDKKTCEEYRNKTKDLLKSILKSKKEAENGEPKDVEAFLERVKEGIDEITNDRNELFSWSDGQDYNMNKNTALPSFFLHESSLATAKAQACITQLEVLKVQGLSLLKKSTMDALVDCIKDTTRTYTTMLRDESMDDEGAAAALSQQLEEDIIQPAEAAFKLFLAAMEFVTVEVVGMDEAEEFVSKVNVHLMKYALDLLTKGTRENVVHLIAQDALNLVWEHGYEVATSKAKAKADLPQHRLEIDSFLSRFWWHYNARNRAKTIVSIATFWEFEKEINCIEARENPQEMVDDHDDDGEEVEALSRGDDGDEDEEEVETPSRGDDDDWDSNASAAQEDNQGWSSSKATNTESDQDADSGDSMSVAKKMDDTDDEAIDKQSKWYNWMSTDIGPIRKEELDLTETSTATGARRQTTHHNSAASGQDEGSNSMRANTNNGGSIRADHPFANLQLVTPSQNQETTKIGAEVSFGGKLGSGGVEKSSLVASSEEGHGENKEGLFQADGVALRCSTPSPWSKRSESKALTVQDGVSETASGFSPLSNVNATAAMEEDAGVKNKDSEITLSAGCTPKAHHKSHHARCEEKPTYFGGDHTYDDAAVNSPSSLSSNDGLAGGDGDTEEGTATLATEFNATLGEGEVIFQEDCTSMHSVREYGCDEKWKFFGQGPLQVLKAGSDSGCVVQRLDNQTTVQLGQLSKESKVEHENHSPCRCWFAPDGDKGKEFLLDFEGGMHRENFVALVQNRTTENRGSLFSFSGWRSRLFGISSTKKDATEI